MRGKGTFLVTATVGLLLAGAVLALPAQAGAAAIYTSTTVDELDDPGPGAGCSLREAIQAANTDGSFGGCFAGPPPGVDEGPDQIYLEPGLTYPRTLTGVEDMNATGDFDIRDESLQIAGFGATIEGNGNVAGDRVFHVVTGPAMGFIVQLTSMTITNGTTAGAGGGILHDSGSLLVGFTTVTGNHAGLFGGGIENTATSTVVNLLNVTISGNTADADGGGVDSAGPLVQTDNTTITGNTADLDNAGGSNGGGIFKRSGAGTFRIANTIVAGNVDASMPGIQAPDCAGDGGFGGSGEATFGYNLIGSTANCGYTAPGPGDILDMPAGLGPLQDNGGETFTHELLPESLAIDRGNPMSGLSFAECAPSDQRGTTRPQGPRCDIGAFERIPTATPPAAITPTPPAVLNPTAPPPVRKKKCKRKKRKRAAVSAKRCKRKRKQGR